MGKKTWGTAIGIRNETRRRRLETRRRPPKIDPQLAGFSLLLKRTTRLRPPDVRSANESSVAQADGASTSAVRPVIRNAVQSLVPLSPHRPSPGNCLREHRE